MNDKNKELFFDDTDGTTVISIPTASGVLEAQVMGALEVDDFDKEYVAVMPVKTTEFFKENELIILVYTEDEDGEARFFGIDDQQELAVVSEAFLQFFAEGM